MTTQGDHTLVRLFHRAEQPTEETRTAVLFVIHGKELGKRYLLNEDGLVLGRSATRATLVISDQAVSSIHARIHVDSENHSFSIEDLGSRNGTYVNAKLAKSALLSEGDKIFLGDTILKFTFLDAIEEKYHHEIDRLMNVDALTGLLVKRSFDLEYAQVFAEARKDKKSLCVLMMDMDGLKSLNDSYGHQMGSYCIAEVGSVIRGLLAQNGFGCRFGGDEFVVCLPEFDLTVACDFAERVRKTIMQHEFCKDGVRVEPTLSIGVAEIGDSAKTPEGLLRLADDALYRAKRAGRNAVCCG